MKKIFFLFFVGINSYFLSSLEAIRLSLFPAFMNELEAKGFESQCDDMITFYKLVTKFLDRELAVFKSSPYKEATHCDLGCRLLDRAVHSVNNLLAHSDFSRMVERLRTHNEDTSSFSAKTQELFLKHKACLLKFEDEFATLQSTIEKARADLLEIKQSLSEKSEAKE